MKKVLLVLFAVTLVAGCSRKSAVTGTSASTTLSGNIRVYNGLGGMDSNSSGVKVTIVEAQKFEYTDSSGDYTFKDIPPGTYNFKFGYRDYPPMFIPNYSVSYDADNVCAIQNPGGPTPPQPWGIGPVSTISCDIDSVHEDNIRYYNVFTGEFSNTMGYFVIVGQRSADTLLKGLVVILGKKYNQVDYASNNYVFLTYAFVPPTDIFYPFSINQVHDVGFVKGDSIYFRIYPVSSMSFYADPVTNQKIFPSIGAGSNIVGAVVQ